MAREGSMKLMLEMVSSMFQSAGSVGSLCICGGVLDGDSDGVGTSFGSGCIGWWCMIGAGLVGIGGGAATTRGTFWAWWVTLAVGKGW